MPRFAVVAGAMVLLAAAMTLGPLAGSALAESQIGSSGSGAGQISDPRGVDVDEAEDLLYVADRANNRISVFDASTGAFVKAFGWGVLNGANELQVCTTTCLQGKEGSGSGQLKQIQGIAVDNESATPGSIYVFDVGNRRVQKFTPEGQFVWMVGDGVNVTTGGDLCTAASGDVCGPGTGGNAEGQFNSPVGDTIDVGPGGTVYVGDRVLDAGIQKTRVQMYSPAGAHLGLLGGKLLLITGGAGNTTALAVDSGSNVYVGTFGENGAVRKYDSSGNELDVFNESFNVNAIATGPSDHVFVADNTEVSEILEYDSAGILLRVFYGSLDQRVVGLAPYPPTPLGDIFAAESFPTRVVAIDFPDPGPVIYPRPSATFANPIGNTKATFNAEVNPEGEATEYFFEYITEADYEAAGNTFGAGTLKTTETPVGGAADFKLHPVQTQVTGLFPETEYRLRAVATNPSGEDTGPTVSFTTKPPVEFCCAWTTGVKTGSANLHAEVNPLGLEEATARFQYTELADTDYSEAKEAPADPIDLGEGEAMVEVSTTVSGLEEKTAYRYRLMVSYRCAPDPAPLCDITDEEKAEGTFTTFATLEAITGCANDGLRTEGSGTFLPDCRGYEMVSPVNKEGSNIDPLFNGPNFLANLDQAALDGGSITYSAYKAFANPQSSPYTNQYLARRTGGGWQSEAISPKREGPSIMTYESAQLDRQYKAFTKDLCSGFLIQDANPILAAGAVAGFPGLYERHNCAPDIGTYTPLTTVEPPNLPAPQFIPELQGISEDGSVAIFTAKDNLTPEAPAQPAACVNKTNSDACLRGLYEARAGQLEYVCILPGETPFAGVCSAGQTSTFDILRGRMSQLGNAISEDGSRIFWTAKDSEAGPLYVRIDGSEPTARTVEVSAAPTTRFWTAAADGSKAIYTVGDELREFDVDEEEETAIAGGFAGFAGASEDASRIYFASSNVLAGEDENSEGDKAEAGEPNLYLYEEGAGFSFIGTLLPSEQGGVSVAGGPVQPWPGARVSRTNESGEQLAFMSYAPLTGYDNKDAVTGEENMEVFLYDATANGGEGAILCPSCNPTNARSEGRELTQNFLATQRAAARISTHTSELYGSRIISEDGNRMYFNSFEALVSTDVNGEEDVYQWSRPGGEAGPGKCTTASPTYHEVSGGCIDLISSGTDPEGSELVDISADGSDVFFKTYESLVGQDPDRLDIYDARVGGGFAGPVAPPIICQGEGCPNPATTPPSPPPAPASTTPGPGNPTWPQPKPKPKKCPKGKHKVKKAGKVRCVKNKKAGKRKAGKSNRAQLSTSWRAGA
ncbi:MAG TPA: hypothetical protein VLI94_03760 [Solirubrobacterales bacterium]|nr:hypothetical protein [Solirubrobacterales bacterium]